MSAKKNALIYAHMPNPCKIYSSRIPPKSNQTNVKTKYTNESQSRISYLIVTSIWKWITLYTPKYLYTISQTNRNSRLWNCSITRTTTNENGFSHTGGWNIWMPGRSQGLTQFCECINVCEQVSNLSTWVKGLWRTQHSCSKHQVLSLEPHLHLAQRWPEACCSPVRSVSVMYLMKQSTVRSWWQSG